ncbi:MAG: hypothetical protein PHN26_05585 [Eubacteriaceae bacterium]|nr:hypothetical protein [Eubacteriaceae bacterium]
MGFQDGQKGFTFGIIAIICWAVSTLLSILGMSSVSGIFGFAVIVLGIMAWVTGKKELAADPENKKAKNGKLIGMIIIILEIVITVAILIISGVILGSAA